MDDYSLVKACDSVKMSSSGLAIDPLLKLSCIGLGCVYWLFDFSSESVRIRRCLSGFTLFKDLKEQLSFMSSGPIQTSSLVVYCGILCYAVLILATTVESNSIV